MLNHHLENIKDMNIVELIIRQEQILKILLLLFQGKDESIVDYTKVFKALLDMAKQAGVTPGWYEVTAKIAYEADRKDLAKWDASSMYQNQKSSSKACSC